MILTIFSLEIGRLVYRDNEFDIERSALRIRLGLTYSLLANISSKD